MLRITTQDDPRVVVFCLEGRLEGPWVQVLDKCWRSTLARSNRTRVRVDLNGVTFVASDGKARLATMHEEGAEFIADDLMTKEIVAEILGK
jgi:hypothetical protein